MEEMFTDFEIIEQDKVKEYKYPGVWAMFGIKKDNNSKKKYTCLNVGKSADIGKELEIDFERMKHFKECKGDKDYINQFNEKVFTYKEYATRQEYEYKDISDKYKSIITILVAKENNYTIEKYFAYSFKAVYWVSGGRYSSEKEIDDSKIESILEDIDISKIDKLLIDKIKKLKDKYDNQ
ncbi:hypothetical protein [Inconstantimicrobium porci]|uniref:hypothetical protein n=1 Tax=Inconstantimicrobium porci TaxID=2652291 RepID=UPI0024092D95|nr:hypothetical protein [Inconstantimicrobium porci]MDD6770885.1 hypothetical protein [Inconstantimicrobium porci]